MRASRILYLGAGLVAVGAVAYPMAALASHGKVGLWEITTTMNMGGVQMPDMSKLPPEAQAQMKKMGVHMSGNTVTTQHCMTAAEVAQDKPPAMQHAKDCTLEHVSVSNGSMSADMVCHGQMEGTGHIQVSYSGAAHYTGSMKMTGTAQGHPVSMSNTFEGHWVSPDCGGVTH
jgi:Protein of unknown function (DUF3617)